MADGGSFFQRIEELAEQVGYEDLIGEVEVNQHYALDQHENMNYEHPRGGGPHFLRDPLLQNHQVYLEAVARKLLEGGGPEAMAESMEHLSSLLDPAAPVDEDPNYIRLRRSGNPKVIDAGIEVYNRPPIDPREPMGPDDDYDSDGFRTGQSY